MNYKKFNQKNHNIFITLVILVNFIDLIYELGKDCLIILSFCLNILF